MVITLPIFTVFTNPTVHSGKLFFQASYSLQVEQPPKLTLHLDTSTTALIYICESTD